MTAHAGTLSPELLKRYSISPLPENLAVRLDRHLFRLRRISSLCVDELHPAFHLPWNTRFWAWRNGFTSKSYVMYQLAHNDSAEYVSEFVQKVRTDNFNGPYNAIVNDKLGFSLLMQACDAPHPPVEAIIRSGRIHPLGSSRPIESRTWLRTRLQGGDGLVIKPLHGFKGLGFAAIRPSETGLTLNGVRAALPDLERIIGTLDDCYVTPFIPQAAYASAIYPSTTNTVRLLTYWDVDRDEPFIAAAVQRIGTRRSFPVDNWMSGRGGLSAPIDLESGELGTALGVTPDGALERHDVHPESGGPISGIQLPHWRRLKDDVLRLASGFSFLPDLCWDCVITDSGSVFLEWNGACALFVFQVHEPLLKDPRVRAFYRRYGVIRS